MILYGRPTQVWNRGRKNYCGAPQRISEENSLLDIIRIFQVHPSYLAQEFGLEREDQFYLSLEEAEIEPEAVEALVNRLYEEADLDPRKLFGGGGGRGCGGGH